MQRWEYKIAQSPEFLDRFGKEGWELVAVTNRYFLFIVVGREWTLKRPVRSDSSAMSNVEVQLRELADQVKTLTWENHEQEHRLTTRLADAFFAASTAFEERATRSNQHFFETDARPELKAMYSNQFFFFSTISDALRAAGGQIRKKIERIDAVFRDPESY
jgi:hypothetical protein